jgi:tetratricopeptide (TPR) repeat protein
VVLRRRKPMQPAEINLAFFQRIKQIGNKLALWTIYFNEYFKETDRRQVAEDARKWQMNMIFKMKSGLGSSQGQLKMTKTLLDSPEVDAYLNSGNMFAKLVAFFVPNYKSKDNRDPSDTFPQLNFEFHFAEYWYYMISALIHIGAAQEKLKKYHLAERYFQKAAEVADQIIAGQSNPDLLKIAIRAYLAIARTLVTQNAKLAIPYLNRCLALNQMVYSFFENEFVTTFYNHCVIQKLEDTRTVFVLIFINFAMCYESEEMTLEMFEAINLARFFVEAFWEPTDQIYRFVADFYDLLNTKYGKMNNELLVLKNVILTNTRKIPNFIVQTDPDHETWDEQILDMHMSDMHINYSKTCAMYGDRNLVPIKKNLANDNFILHRAINSSKPSGTD